jgi:hypothetical protein
MVAATVATLTTTQGVHTVYNAITSDPTVRPLPYIPAALCVYSDRISPTLRRLAMLGRREPSLALAVLMRRARTAT